jgi:hypothetical protein
MLALVSPKKRDDEEAPELLTWDPSDGTDEDEDDIDDELPADEAFEGDEAVEGDEPEPLAAKSDDFAKDRPASLPQPDRARSHPDLPKVTTSSFKRLIR